MERKGEVGCHLPSLMWSSWFKESYYSLAPQEEHRIWRLTDFGEFVDWCLYFFVLNCNRIVLYTSLGKVNASWLVAYGRFSWANWNDWRNSFHCSQKIKSLLKWFPATLNEWNRHFSEPIFALFLCLFSPKLLTVHKMVHKETEREYG